MAKKDPLGRGLSAILKDVDERGGSQAHPSNRSSPIRPSRGFRHEGRNALQELAVSIKEKGLLQPILVKKKERVYEIIAGERRYRAAEIAGLHGDPRHHQRTWTTGRPWSSP